MNWISTICFIICFGIICSCFRRGADIFSPGKVFGFVWSIAFGLTNLKLSGLQYNWEPIMWFQVILGPISFLIGCFICYVLHLNRRLFPIESIRTKLQQSPVNERRLFYLTILFVIVYLSSYLVIYLVKGFVPLFSPFGASSRTEFSMFGLGLCIQSMPIIIFATVLYHLKIKGHFKERLLLKILSTICAITFFLLLQRFQFIMTIIMIVTLLYYSTRYWSARKAILIFLTAVSLFYWISTLRAGQFIQYYSFLASKMKYSPKFALFTEPYMYMVMNLENFAHAVSKSDYFTYGYYSFDFIFAFSGIKHWIKDYFVLVDNPYLTSGYNTYSAFWTYYRDFGIVGVFVFSLIQGFGTGLVYYSLRKNPTIFKVSAYSVLVFIMAISFFNFPVAFIWFAYVIASLALILKLTVVRTQPGIAS